VAVYAAQSDIENAIGVKELASFADDDGNGTTDPVIVTRALSDASSIADGYIAPWLPLAIVPDALRLAVVHIAVQNMRLGRNQATEDSTKAFDAAMAWLKDIAKGLVQLLPPSAPDVVDPGDPEMYAEERVWTRSTGGGIF